VIGFRVRGLRIGLGLGCMVRDRVYLYRRCSKSVDFPVAIAVGN